MKNRFWKIALALIAVGLCLAAAGLCAVRFDWNELSGVPYETKTVCVTEPFDRIEVTADEYEVAFAQSERCAAVYPGNEFEEVSVRVEDGALRIVQQNLNAPWYVRWFQFTEKTLLVELPRQAYESLTVKTGSGDIELAESFDLGTISLNTGSGSIVLNSGAEEIAASTASGEIAAIDVTAKAIRLSTASGDIAMTRVCADEADASTASGRIRCADMDIGILNLNTASGDADVEDADCGQILIRTSSGQAALANVIARENIAVQTESGDIRLTGCDARTLEMRTESGCVKGDLLSPKQFAAQTRSGSISLPPSGGNGSCLVSTRSGDISLRLTQ